MDQRAAIVERLAASEGASFARDDKSTELLIPISHHRKGKVQPLGDDIKLKVGDEVTFVLSRAEQTQARNWLTAHGFEPPAQPEPESEAEPQTGTESTDTDDDLVPQPT